MQIQVNAAVKVVRRPEGIYFVLAYNTFVLLI